MKTNNTSFDGTINLNDGRQLGFAEYGIPQGQPIFYFHGFPGSRLEAKHFHAIASEQDYRLIGVDRPGMGLSSIDKKRTILSFVSDIEALAKTLHIDTFSIISHSGGAPFAAGCAYAIPHRINKIAIVSGMAPIDELLSSGKVTIKERFLNQSIKLMPYLATLMMRITRLMLKKPNMMNKMIQQLPIVDQKFFQDESIKAEMITATLEAFRNGMYGPSQELKLILNHWGFSLKKITIPVSIWHGSLDTQAPLNHAMLYAELIQNTQLHVLDQEGHLSLIRNHFQNILE